MRYNLTVYCIFILVIPDLLFHTHAVENPEKISLFPTGKRVVYSAKGSMSLDSKEGNANCNSKSELAVIRSQYSDKNDNVLVTYLSGDLNLLISEKITSNSKKEDQIQKKSDRGQSVEIGSSLLSCIPIMLDLQTPEWTSKENIIGMNLLFQNQLKKLDDRYWILSSNGTYDYKSNLERVTLGKITVIREIKVDIVLKVPVNVSLSILIQKPEFKIKHAFEFTLKNIEENEND